MSNICDIYNYADDNTLGCGENIVDVTNSPPPPTNKLEHATGVMLNWFNYNLMQANRNKFHYILFNRNNTNEINSICARNMTL